MTSLVDFIRGGGIIMIPLIALSLGAVAVIVERLLAFRAFGSNPPGLLKRVLELARAARFDEALRACDGAPGPLAAVLSTVLGARDRPVGVAERRVEEVGQDFFIRLERGLPFLDTVTTIAPLLGLLGTILGMIGTFNAIGVQQRSGGNSDAVLAGVGEALYATAAGITIAVVCFVAYNAFAARLRSVTSQTEQGATKLINALLEERADYFPEAERVSPVSNGTINGAREAGAASESNHAVQTAPRA